MTWDKHTKPPADVCPQGYCFFWMPAGGRADISRRLYDSVEDALAHGDWVEFPEGGCNCRWGVCRRFDPVGGDRDWYEPCEPHLERDGLPWFYFVPTVDKLTPDLRDEYLRESQKLWGEPPSEKPGAAPDGSGV